MHPFIQAIHTFTLYLCILKGKSFFSVDNFLHAFYIHESSLPQGGEFRYFLPAMLSRGWGFDIFFRKCQNHHPWALNELFFIRRSFSYTRLLTTQNFFSYSELIPVDFYLLFFILLFFFIFFLLNFIYFSHNYYYYFFDVPECSMFLVLLSVPSDRDQGAI